MGLIPYYPIIIPYLANHLADLADLNGIKIIGIAGPGPGIDMNHADGLGLPGSDHPSRFRSDESVWKLTKSLHGSV